MGSPRSASLLALRETKRVGSNSGMLRIDIKLVLPSTFEAIADVKLNVKDKAIEPKLMDTIRGISGIE